MENEVDAAQSASVEIAMEWLQDLLASPPQGTSQWDSLTDEQRVALAAVVESSLNILAESIPTWLPHTMIGSEDREHLSITYRVHVPQLARDVARICQARQTQREKRVQEMQSWVTSDD